MTNRLAVSFAESTAQIIRQEIGQPVELVDPDGIEYTQSAENPAAKIMGMIQWESRDLDLKTGMDTMVQRPVVSLSLSDLERIPDETLENGKMAWIVRIPESPLSDNLVSYTLAGPPKKFTTLNFINLKLRRLSQI